MRGDMRPFVEDRLSESKLVRHGIFEPKEVRKLLAKNQNGLVDASHTLLSILCIELWFDKFMTGTQPGVPSR